MVELSWCQDTMSHDDCFFFRISESGHVHRICCSYTDPVTYERIAVGNENAVAECPVILEDRWEDIVDLVQTSKPQVFRLLTLMIWTQSIARLKQHGERKIVSWSMNMMASPLAICSIHSRQLRQRSILDHRWNEFLYGAS